MPVILSRVAAGLIHGIMVLARIWYSVEVIVRDSSRKW